MLTCARVSRFSLLAGNDVGYEEMLKEGRFTSYGGLPACADASCNLANPSHVDVRDAWRSYAVWVRSQPQKPIGGWWFLFPDVGLAIELQDSVSISWDGRECAHATSAPATPLAEGDALLSLFFSLPSNVLTADERCVELQQALVARGACRGRLELQVGERVWGKWYPSGAPEGSDGWRRATGVVHALTEGGGVVVSWLHESGRGMSLTALSLEHVESMLVRAGFVSPVHVGCELGGEALVGYRVRVYWPGEDRVYAGLVEGWDPVAGTHNIVYDDGDVLWELLGGVEATPWFVCP